MDTGVKIALISSTSVVIAAIITGIFTLYQGWLPGKNVETIDENKKDTIINIPKEDISREKSPQINVTKKGISKKKTQINVGDRVLAINEGNVYLYPGTVQETREGKYRIFYEFGGEKWVEEKYIYLPNTPNESDMIPNTEVYIHDKSEGQDKWVPATIKEIRAGKYHVNYEGKKIRAWIKLENIILR